MKVIVEVNTKWLVSVEANSMLEAEHKLLEYEGVWAALAYDRDMLKTDTFAGAVQFCEMISMNELAEMSKQVAEEKKAAEAARRAAEEAEKAQKEVEKELKRIEEMLRAAKSAYLDAASKANSAKTGYEAAQYAFGMQRN